MLSIIKTNRLKFLNAFWTGKAFFVTKLNIKQHHLNQLHQHRLKKAESNINKHNHKHVNKSDKNLVNRSAWQAIILLAMVIVMPFVILLIDSNFSVIQEVFAASKYQKAKFTSAKLPSKTIAVPFYTWDAGSNWNVKGFVIKTKIYSYTPSATKLTKVSTTSDSINLDTTAKSFDLTSYLRNKSIQNYDNKVTVQLCTVFDRGNGKTSQSCVSRSNTICSFAGDSKFCPKRIK